MCDATIKINNKLPKYEYIETIRHELAHVITGARDNTKEFEEFCNKHNISLTHSCNIGERYKYELYCEGCDTLLKKYKRNVHTIKHIRENPDCWQCMNCDTDGKLVVKKID